jgi:hypothetical protein
MGGLTPAIGLYYGSPPGKKLISFHATLNFACPGPVQIVNYLPPIYVQKHVKLYLAWLLQMEIT